MKKFCLSVVAVLLALLALQYFRGESVQVSLDQDGPRLRLVSLAPSLTEVLFELGCGNGVVGVTSYCTYPPEALKREKVGAFVDPNFEKIVSLRPDLVLAERWPTSKTVSRLRQLGVRVVETISPHSIREIPQLILEVGAAVGKAEQARALVRKVEERLEEIRLRGSRFPHRPRVYVEIDLPSWTVGARSFITDALFLCGARNVFADLERPSFQVSREQVLEEDPEIILSLEATASQIAQRPGWEGLSAVRTGHIIDNLDRSLLSHGNHRLLDGMEQLQRKMAELLKVDLEPEERKGNDF